MMMHHEHFEATRLLLPSLPALVGLMIYFGRRIWRRLTQEGT